MLTLQKIIFRSTKIKDEDPQNPLLIVCGDFNGGSECGAVRYLEDGGVGPTFLEDGESITSKEKNCPTSYPLKDVISSVSTRPEPPTLVVAELISQMAKDQSSAYKSLSDDVIDRLKRCFTKYATEDDEEDLGINGKVMSTQDVEKWLVDINKQVGRGSEFRTAAKEMGWTEPKVEESEDGPIEKPRITLPQESFLSLNGFINVYEQELHDGKFWGIAYDLGIMGEPLPMIGRFEGRYDRMYCTGKLEPTAVIDFLSTVPCPNDNEPSDHLPVAASFKFSELN
jgi:hypothetical protein